VHALQDGVGAGDGEDARGEAVLDDAPEDLVVSPAEFFDAVALRF
jgi:hypothetical protein